MNWKEKSRRAFSLFEVVATVAILSLVLGIAIYNFGGKSGKNESAAAAKMLRDLLVQCRTQAAATDEPTGVAFPGDATVYAQSYYKISGRGLLIMESQKSWSSEFPPAFVTWASVGSETTNSRLSYESYDLAAMTGIDGNDPILLFTPNGEVLARGIPFDGTHLHLRVGTSPSGGSGSLSGMNEVWDIRVDLRGNILLERDNGFPSGGGTPPGTDSLPSTSPPPGATPLVTSISPAQDLVDTGSGLSLATLEENIQLVTEAESPSGLPLFIQWSSDGGQFSDDAQWSPMTYSPDDNRWKSSIFYSLPATPTATQTVSVKVRDRYNNVSADTALSSLTFDTSGPIRAGIFFVSRPDGSSNSSIETVNGDGSGRRPLVEGLSQAPVLAASPSGQFLAWLGDGNLDNNQIAISDTEGEILQVVALPGPLSYDIAWSEDSRQVVVSATGANPTSVWTVDVDGATISTLASLSGSCQRPSVSSNLERIVYRKQGNNTTVFCFDTTTSTETVIYSDPSMSNVGSFRISQAGNYCGFVASQMWDSNGIVASTDGSSPPLDLGPGSQPTISPDETKIIYINREPPGPKLEIRAIDGTLIHSFSGFNGPNATERQHAFTPDSAYAIFQAGVWFDHRLMGAEVSSGTVFELLKDDNLNKFSPNVVTRVGP